MRQVPLWVSAPLVVGVFGVLLWLEHRRPLRRSVESKLTRTARNVAVVAVGAAALQVTERPVTAPLTAWVEQGRWGILKWISLPMWVEVPLAVLLLDYTLYVWHVLTHKVSWLWRFHVMHHVDLDLDASTALRFHFGELIISAAWRAGQVILIGVSPFSLSVWQTVLLLSIMFHHSNVRLSVKTERWLNRLIVTPRMHGIHHSIIREETNSNWSSGLTLWDWLHGTLRLNVPQDEITIGVPAYRESQEATLPKILKMPFGKERPIWQLPGGEQPTRPPLSVAPHHLLA
jgi:sterol desaturase/sphingolipid hydroxylase (fatty acid hydroxylase superfamily)